MLHDESGIGPLVSPGGGLRRIGEDDMRVDALNSRGRLVHTDVSLHELGVGEALREAAEHPETAAPRMRWARAAAERISSSAATSPVADRLSWRHVLVDGGVLR